MDIVERFWSSVDIKGDDECWMWLKSQSGRGYATGTGYGQFGISRNKNIGAHRFSAMLKYGMFDKRLFVMHTCDNPPCVNPAHLVLGTHTDNMQDMQKKGRKAILANEDAPNARLTNKEVEEIRARYIKGHRFRPGNRDSLAKEYGVSPSYIIGLVIPSSTRRRIA